MQSPETCNVTRLYATPRRPTVLRYAIQFITTYITLVAAFLTQNLLSQNSDLTRGEAGVGQLSDNPAAIAASRELQRHDYSGLIVWTVAIVIILVIWGVPFLIDRIRTKRAEWRVLGM